MRDRGVLLTQHRALHRDHFAIVALCACIAALVLEPRQLAQRRRKRGAGGARPAADRDRALEQRFRACQLAAENVDMGQAGENGRDFVVLAPGHLFGQRQRALVERLGGVILGIFGFADFATWSGIGRVAWTSVAERDLERTLDVIADDKPAAAGRLLDRIRRAARALTTLPAGGRIVPELSRVAVQTHRELIIAPYRLIYRIDDARVNVVALLDGRRDLEDLLLARLLDD